MRLLLPDAKTRLFAGDFSTERKRNDDKAPSMAALHMVALTGLGRRNVCTTFLECVRNSHCGRFPLT
jgi:hypothetical protein